MIICVFIVNICSTKIVIKWFLWYNNVVNDYCTTCICAVQVQIFNLGDNMEKIYRFRIYPNNQQKILIQKTFGCCRFVYNYFLSKCIEVYETEKKTLSYYDCCKLLTTLKQEYPWLKEPDKCSLQNSLKDLDQAYKRFFSGQNGYPNHKTKKSHHSSYRTQNYNLQQPTSAIVFQNKRIKLPKLGWVKVKDKQVPTGRILNVTIVQKSSGKYYASVCCTDVEMKILPKTNSCIGIDLGIKDLAITNTGVKYENPKFLKKSLDKLAQLQRELSRKTRGSSNYEKARIKVARQYEKITNQHIDYLQKLSTKLISENDIICIEDLSIHEMVLNRWLSREIMDASWSKLTRFLQYKADWYGKKIIKVDRYFASSQTCHCCGVKNPITKNNNIRKWICPNCGSELDRDVNAAINILNEGLKQIA